MPVISRPVLSIAVQAGLIVHVIKTGRNSLWIWAIALLPPAGPIAYVVAQILPKLVGGKTGTPCQSGHAAHDRSRSGSTSRQRRGEISGNVDARRRLAEELFDRSQYDEAISVYEGGLKGIFEHDPTLLLGLAQAQFAKKDFAAARASLERLIQNNPDFKSTDGHLLYARTLEEQNALDEAEHEYAAIAQAYPGAEARLRYAVLLKRRGKTEQARNILKDLLDGAQLGPAHYRRAQAQWLDRARRELG